MSKVYSTNPVPGNVAEASCGYGRGCRDLGRVGDLRQRQEPSAENAGFVLFYCVVAEIQRVSAGSLGL